MKFCCHKLPPEFQSFEHRESGAFWRGVVRCGNALPSEAGREMINLCRDLVDGNMDIIKDRPKIKAGVDGKHFVKLYKLPGMAAQFRRRFRKGRAYHCLFAAEALHKYDVLTPKVLAAVELRCGWYICDFLITEALPAGVRTLNFCSIDERCSRSSMRDFVIGQVLLQTVKMHNGGVAHGDLNLRNIYAVEDRVGFIDLDGTTFSSEPLKITAREKELARLLSGFLRFDRFKDMNIDELAAGLVEAYGRSSGVQCDKNRIVRRAEYLLGRL
ncbi:MAG: hypothetical protein J6R86_09855 [Lentisphaeria bacterium]|nr:hypothetical protein [Lentisphaeria bacterium]